MIVSHRISNVSAIFQWGKFEPGALRQIASGLCCDRKMFKKTEILPLIMIQNEIRNSSAHDQTVING